jgi:hypothetical protein
MHQAIPAAVCAAVFLVSGSTLRAQELHSHGAGTPGTVDTVIITGNTKTKAYVILNEMSFQPGMPITPEVLEFDRNRVYSLGLFTRVDFFPDTLGTPRILQCSSVNAGTFSPCPFSGFATGT